MEELTDSIKKHLRRSFYRQLSGSRYISASKKHFINVRDHGRCQECGEVGTEYGHIHPYSKGGNTSVFNLALICYDCNRKIGAKHWQPKHRLYRFLCNILYEIGAKV